MNVAERLARARERMRHAEELAGRAPQSVRLIAVSKLQPVAAIREAYAAGQRDFGENYAQELTRKAEELRDLPELHWHFIGHLQRNKARLVVPHLDMIHTIDSLPLTQELGRRAAQQKGSGPLRALVEVSIAGEAEKSGCAIEDLEAVLRAVEAEPGLELCGLMCVPPVTRTPEEARPHFDALRALRDTHGGSQRLPELSMGMTADLEVAIEAGATLVRVGTAIFGPRPERSG